VGIEPLCAAAHPDYFLLSTDEAIQFYADATYGRAFRYDSEDLARARRNEQSAAERGLGAAIEDPFTGKPILMRDFLRRTLTEIGSLAEALDRGALLEPLCEMAAGGPNTAGRMRDEIRRKLGQDTRVPLDLLRELAEKREAEVSRDVERIAGELVRPGQDSAKWQEVLGRARDEARREPGAPIRFQAPLGAWFGVSYPNKTAEIVDLAKQLIRIPSVTNAPPGRQRLDEVHRAATLIYDYLRQAELEVKVFDKGKYPAILASFPGQNRSPVMLCGHFDVVSPDPDDSQFEPVIDGDYLRGRGAADMKTVVATYLVWMKDARRRSEAFPGINLLLVGNEEIGEGEPTGTPHVLKELLADNGYGPQLLIAGERTGEKGDEIMGGVCLENRGLVRLEISARGERAHTGMAGAPLDLSVRLFRARDELMSLLEKRLTLKGDGGWQSQVRFPFVRVGEDGIFNVTASRGILGIEIRPIPQDPISGLVLEIGEYCSRLGLELEVVAAEDGIVCGRENIFLEHLLHSVREVSERDPALGRKLPATSARFAPGGQGVVWGQTGIGPHAAEERHFLPSIAPYYGALSLLGEKCRALEKD
jgi:acetylornithine deacetylase/succinyl-diaminopimelate desuccinylase-like protein